MINKIFAKNVLLIKSFFSNSCNYSYCFSKSEFLVFSIISASFNLLYSYLSKFIDLNTFLSKNIGKLKKNILITKAEIKNYKSVGYSNILDKNFLSRHF